MTHQPLTTSDVFRRTWQTFVVDGEDRDGNGMYDTCAIGRLLPRSTRRRLDVHHHGSAVDDDAAWALIAPHVDESDVHIREAMSAVQRWYDMGDPNAALRDRAMDFGVVLPEVA